MQLIVVWRCLQSAADQFPRNSLLTRQSTGKFTAHPPLRPASTANNVLLSDFAAIRNREYTREQLRPGIRHPQVVNGKRAISPSFAITLESVLGTSAEMWVRMQAEYDLWEARQMAA